MVHGGDSGRLQVPVTVLRELIDALIEGAERTSRFLAEGKSVRKGPKPAWIARVADTIEITELSTGSIAVSLDAPPLGDISGSPFATPRQPSLLHDVGVPERFSTAIDLFGETIASLLDSVPGDADAEVDRELLDTCVRFTTLPTGFEAISLSNIAGRDAPVRVDRVAAAQIRRLRDATPVPEAVRVSGVLDTISASRPTVELMLANDERVKVRLDGVDVDRSGLYEQPVVVSGIAHFLPNGRLHHIDGEVLTRATESDAVFGKRPVARTSQPLAPHIPQDMSSGVSSFFGSWPGDEDENDLLEALRANG